MTVASMGSSARHTRRNRSSELVLTPLLGTAGLLRALAVALLLCVLIMGWTQVQNRPVEGIATAYLAANLLLFLNVVVDHRRGGVSLLSSFFFLFFVAIPARLQIADDVFPFGSHYQSDDLVMGFVVLAAAQLAFHFGQTVRVGSTRDFSLDVSEFDVRMYLRVAIVVTVISLVIAAYVGPSLLFTTREEIGAATGTSSIAFQLLLIGRSFSLFGSIVCLYVFATAGAASRNATLGLLMGFSAATFFVLNFPPGLPRFQLLGSGLALSATTVVYFRTRIKAIFALGAPVFLLFVFPVLKSLGTEGAVSRASFASTDVHEYLLRVDFDAFKQIVDTTRYLQTEPIRYGENFLGVLAFWVPRGIWSGKPVHSGELVSSRLGYPYTNVSSPLPAESMMAFGFAGIIVVFGVLGWFVARLEYKVGYAQQTGRIARNVLLYALAIGYSTIILRGALNAVAPMFASGFLLYWWVSWRMARRGSRATS